MLQKTSTQTTSRAAQAPLIIRRVDAIPVALPLKAPMKMANALITAAYNLLVRIEADDGTVGWGEAASAPTMTGDTLGGLVAAVKDVLGPLLIGKDAWQRQDLVRMMRHALMANPGAHSAVEMALLDLAGHVAGKPLIELVASARRKGVKPMWLLGNATPEEDIAEARERQKQGFNFFKLKIGVKPIDKEIATALTIREALGAKTPLCADANCGLTRASARRYIDKTRQAKLMFVEQPLAHDDLAGLKALTRGLKMSIGIDEGIHSIADIEANKKCGAGGISLKLIKVGGITAAIDTAKLCRKLGLSINVAAKIAESSIGSAAAVHLACAVPNVDWGVSITHFYLADDIVKKPLSLSAGLVALPTAPGLGIEVDEAAVERFRVK